MPKGCLCVMMAWRSAQLGGLFLSGCLSTEQQSEPSVATTAAQAFANASRIVDCEHHAANQFDDGRSAISVVAQQVMDVCTVERLKARMAFHFSPTDPDLDADDFKQALEIVEDDRKSRPR